MLTETLLLPQQEVAVFRSLERTATVLLIIFRLDVLGRTPVTRNQIAAIMDISRPTAGEYLESLCYQGLVTRTGFHTGYTLSIDGRQLLLGQALDAGGAPSERAIGALKDLGSQAGLPVSLEAQKTETTVTIALDAQPTAEHEPTTRIAESRVKKDLTLEKQSQIFPILEEEEERSKRKNIIDLPPPPPLRELDFLTLLEKSEILFGPPGVVARGLIKRPGDVVLGWMAQAYNERHSLDRPAGLVYRRLQEGRVAKSPYQENPEKYLPRTYLEAIGLKEPEEIEQEETEMAPFVMEPDETLTAKPQGSNFSPIQAFERIWAELERTTPRGTYLHWMASCQPLHYEDGIMTIGVVDLVTERWMSERMTKTVAQGMSGYLARPVSVVFQIME